MVRGVEVEVEVGGVGGGVESAVEGGDEAEVVMPADSPVVVDEFQAAGVGWAQSCSQ